FHAVEGAVEQEDEGKLDAVAGGGAPDTNGETAAAGVLAEGVEAPGLEAAIALGGPEVDVTAVFVGDDAGVEEALDGIVDGAHPEGVALGGGEDPAIADFF